MPDFEVRKKNNAEHKPVKKQAPKRSSGRFRVFAVRLLVLLLAVALSSLAWMGVVTTREDYVIKAGNVKVSATDWQRMYHRERQEIQKLLPDEAASRTQEARVKEHIISKLVQEALLYSESSDIDLLVSDEVVKRFIIGHPRFLNKKGKFDIDKYKEHLSNLGMTEREFLLDKKREVLEFFLSNAFWNNNIDAFNLKEPMLDIMSDIREVEVFNINPTAEMLEKSLDDIDEQEVNSFIEKHPDMFYKQEERDLSYIMLTEDLVAGSIQIKEDDIRQMYNDRQSWYVWPETRTVKQIRVSDEIMALQLHNMVIVGGKSLEDAIQELNLPDESVDTKEFTKYGLNEEVKDAIFDTSQGLISEPVRTAFGWNIYKVLTIRPEYTRSFDDVRPELERYYWQQTVYEKLSNLSEKINMDIAGGASLSDLQKKYNIVVRSMTNVDKVGMLKNIEENEGYDVFESEESRGVNYQALLSAAFRTDGGMTSYTAQVYDFGKYPFALFIFRVQKIHPRTTIDTEQAIKKAKFAIRGGKVEEATRNIAEKVKEALERGESAEEVQDRFEINPPCGAVVSYLGKVANRNEDCMLTDAVRKYLSDMSVGDVSDIEEGQGGPRGYFLQLARVRSVRKAEDNLLEEHEDILNRRLPTDIESDFIHQYISYLRDKHGVDYNTKLNV